MSRADYCIGCGRPRPCPKKTHTEPEQARLDAERNR